MKTMNVVLIVVLFLVFADAAGALDYGAKVELPVVVDKTGDIQERMWKTDWSPDGKWIAVGVGYDIWIISTRDWSMKNITEDIDERCCIPAFIPFTDEVMFSRAYTIKEGDVLYQSYNLESIDVNTGDERIVLEEAFAGSISRDSKYIVYDFWPGTSAFSLSDHALYDVESEESTMYGFLYRNSETKPYFNFGHSCISNDDSYFVTTLLKDWGDNPNALYRVSLDGKTVELLLDDADPWYPKYSPDGKWLLYTRGDNTSKRDESRNVPAKDICVYEVDTGTCSNLLPDNPYNSLCGSWSPDGQKICYILDKNGTYELYVREFEFAAPDLPLDVNEEPVSSIALNGAFPNPFNSSTTITFTLPVSGYTNISLFNISGQRIRELLSENMTPGFHTVVWDGSTDNGVPVSAGVYITQLRQGNEVKTGRVVFVK